jgi:ABC-type sugar transport system permease subunit
MTLATAQSRKRKKSWQSTDMLLAILVLLPSIIAVAIFIYTAMGWTFYISTVKWNSQIRDFTFVGLRNWNRLLMMPVSGPTCVILSTMLPVL